MERKFDITDYEVAVDYIMHAHRKQVRAFTQIPYFTHPIRTAALVMKYKKSHKINELIIVALLHDTLEDTNTTEEDIKGYFGTLVASLVMELTSDKGYKGFAKTMYLIDKINGMSSWAKVIKLCDRLDNVSDFVFCPKSFVDKYKTETGAILVGLEAEKLTDTHKRIITDIKKVLDLYKE